MQHLRTHPITGNRASSIGVFKKYQHPGVDLLSFLSLFLWFGSWRQLEFVDERPGAGK
jgi:hypothetical protein